MSGEGSTAQRLAIVATVATVIGVVVAVIAILIAHGDAKSAEPAKTADVKTTRPTLSPRPSLLPPTVVPTPTTKTFDVLISATSKTFVLITEGPDDGFGGNLVGSDTIPAAEAVVFKVQFPFELQVAESPGTVMVACNGRDYQTLVRVKGITKVTIDRDQSGTCSLL